MHRVSAAPLFAREKERPAEEPEIDHYEIAKRAMLKRDEAPHRIRAGRLRDIFGFGASEVLPAPKSFIGLRPKSFIGLRSPPAQAFVCVDLLAACTDPSSTLPALLSTVSCAGH